MPDKVKLLVTEPHRQNGSPVYPGQIIELSPVDALAAKAMGRCANCQSVDAGIPIGVPPSAQNRDDDVGRTIAKRGRPKL